MSTHLGDAPKKVNDTRKCRRRRPNNAGQDFGPGSSRISQTPGIRAPKPDLQTQIGPHVRNRVTDHTYASFTYALAAGRPEVAKASGVEPELMDHLSPRTENSFKTSSS
jgi:hypothetical protein